MDRCSIVVVIRPKNCFRRGRYGDFIDCIQRWGEDSNAICDARGRGEKYIHLPNMEKCPCRYKIILSLDR